MPLTDKSDAELAALVCERVLNMSEHIIDEEDPENYPVFQMWGDGNPGPGVGVVIYRERAAWYDNLPGCFDPANDLSDIWAACERAKERGLILGFSVTDDPDGYTQAPQARVIGPGYLVYIERTDPRASGRLTIALLRACGMEEE